MNSETIIQTHNLSVYYGTYRGIKDVNLSIQKGGVFGFLGPNGGGKTTTQRVILNIIINRKTKFLFLNGMTMLSSIRGVAAEALSILLQKYKHVRGFW